MAITLDLLDSSFHSVEIKDASGQALAIDGSGFLTIANTSFAVTDGGGSLTVDGVDFDIRDLDSASDSVEIKTAAGQALTIDGSGFITANINGTVTVSATDLDIRDLTHVSDSVKVGDGTDFLGVNADGSIDVNSTPGGYGSWLVSTESVGTTESELVSSPLSGRRSVLIQNTSSNDIFLKEATGVTTVNGLRLPKGSSFEASLDSVSNIFAIAGSGTNSIQVVEFAA